jgi:hypothetical protein
MIRFEIPKFQPGPKYWNNFIYQLRSQTGKDYHPVYIHQELNKYGARYHFHSVLESTANDFVEFEDEKQLLLFLLRYS